MRQAILFLVIAAVCLGCDPLANPVSGRLVFTSDTISFDTVFSGIGSATLELRVINDERDPVLIDRIWLGGGSASPFRLNINGAAETECDDIVLAKGDSLFIFVDVTIDPNGENSPLYVLDSINFSSGSFYGDVILEAWGQDIWLYDDKVIDADTQWTSAKPYVIASSLFIDTLATLTLDPGTKIYFHYGAGFTVAGSLKAEGLSDNRILMATDRLEDEYADVPGRWQGINFLGCSRNNILDYTDIRNAVMAAEINGTATSQPDLEMNGTRLIHNTVASLVAYNSEVLAVNTVFAHSGFSTVSLHDGGEYTFIHCTMSDRWEYSYRSEPVLYITPGTGTLPEVTVINSVITGTLDNELDIDATASEAALRFTADSSLIIVDTTSSTWYSTALFTDVQTLFDAGFIDENSWDFRPDSLSPMVDRAGRTESVLWPYDIRGKFRPAGDGPDIGAYERQLGERKEESSK